jgi:adenylate kinase
MKKRIVFIGGPHGVGKTTVIAKLQKSHPHILLFDPGDLFWKLHYDNKILEPRAIEKIVADCLIKTKQEIMFVNWHYAVWTKNGYIPQISLDVWCHNFCNRFRGIINLFLLELDAKTLLARRTADANSGKKRKLDMACVEEEIDATHNLFLKIRKETGRYSNEIVQSVILKNNNSEDSANTIQTFLSKPW